MDDAASQRWQPVRVQAAVRSGLLPVQRELGGQPVLTSALRALVATATFDSGESVRVQDYRVQCLADVARISQWRAELRSGYATYPWHRVLAISAAGLSVPADV